MNRVKDIPLFSKMSEENLKNLEKISQFRSYDTDEIVFYEGDRPGTLYILTEGVLRLYKTDPKGNEIYIHQFTPVGLVGELACFENVNYPATARFITKGQLLKIDYRKLEEDFFQNPAVCMEIIKSLTKKVKILSNVIHKEMILTSEAKVAKIIIEHSELFETLKNTQIASIINITPETLSRILNKFKTEEYIEGLKAGNIIVKEPEALESVIETNKVQDCTNCIVHFKMEPPHDKWVSHFEEFPNRWVVRRDFDFSRVWEISLVDITREQNRVGDSLKVLYYNTDEGERIKMIFEFSEGERYDKYSGWKRIYSQYVLYDAPVKSASIEKIREVLLKLIPVWYESHLKGDRNIIIDFVKKNFPKGATFTD
jgi:CRP/FNR family transcriptional regulator